MNCTRQLSPKIAVICEQFEEKKFISYKPFLSEKVHHLVYSFWYLPRHISNQIGHEIPPLTLRISDDKKSLQIDFNWIKFLDVLLEKDKINSACTQVEMVCAFALAAELQLDKFLEAQKEHGWTFDTPDSPLVHKEQFDFLLGMIHPLRPGQEREKNHGSLSLESLEGEFYMSFLIIITILEKALYDLYCYYQSMEKNHLVKKKNMILRDLLHSNLLETILPSGFLQVLKLLFLPNGLNLRNLVWHGFLSPFEFPKCFTALTFVLLFQIPTFYKTAKKEEEEKIKTLSSNITPSSLFQLTSFDDKYVWPPLLVSPSNTCQDKSKVEKEVVKKAHSIKVDTWWQEMEMTFKSTNLIPRGRIRFCLKSLRWLLLGKNELLGCFGLIPILEHTIRLYFYEIHQEIIHPRIKQAQVDEYYSTIDGFGQKTKHQILLYPFVNPSILLQSDSIPDSEKRVKNLLYTTLPRAVLHGLLDLCMMASGPNVRARLCHGEADLTTLSHLMKPPRAFSIRHSLSELSRTSVLLLETFLLLCTHTSSATGLCFTDRLQAPLNARAVAVPLDVNTTFPSPSPPPGHLSQMLETFRSSYVSSFHPIYQIARALESNQNAMEKLNKEMLNKYQPVILPVSMQDQKEIEEQGLEDHKFLVHFPHLNNIYIREKISRLQDLGLIPSSSSSTTSLKSTIKKKKQGSLYDYIQMVQLHFEQVYTSIQIHMKQYHHTDDDDKLDTLNYTSRIDLSEFDDGQLKMTGCIMEILNCLKRCMEFFWLKLKTLFEWIQNGQARTNHRRSCLLLIQFYPLFQTVLQWSLQMIHHQMNCFLLLNKEEICCSTITSTSSQTCVHLTSILPKVFHFLTSFEGCLVPISLSSTQTQTQTQSQNSKSIEKAIQLTNQFLQTKLIQKINY